MINETAERLKRLIPEIMNKWVERTLHEVKAANLQETLALRNSLPNYLSLLVDALSTTIDRTEARKRFDLSNSTRIGKKHGRERASATEYTMDQMILEYHILRQVICDLLEKEAPLTPVEREIIVCSIEQAVNIAATQFSDTLRDFQEQLAHTLVHDLRNPLTTVKISAQLLCRQLNDREHLEKVERILQGTQRIDKMVQELLDASLAKATRKKLEFSECNLSWLVRDIAFELNISSTNRIQVEASENCFGFGNANSIRRMIENLATNAIKYGSENTPITFGISQSDEWIFLKVHNFGHPIFKEEQPLLFEKFNRGSTAVKQAGWGIGLNVVKDIVDAHHGTIKIDSDEINGTTFTVTIPKSKTVFERAKNNN